MLAKNVRGELERLGGRLVAGDQDRVEDLLLLDDRLHRHQVVPPSGEAGVLARQPPQPLLHGLRQRWKSLLLLSYVGL